MIGKISSRLGLTILVFAIIILFVSAIFVLAQTLHRHDLVTSNGRLVENVKERDEINNPSVKYTDTLDIHPTNLSYPADLSIKVGDIYYLQLRNTTKGVNFPVQVVNKNPVDVEAVRVIISIQKWQSPFDSDVAWHRKVYDEVISVPKAEKGFWGYYYATKSIPVTVSDLEIGRFSVQACVNPGASVPETNYNDNSDAKTFEVSRRPTLPSVWVCRQW